MKPNLPLCHNQAILTETEFALDGRLGELEHLVAEIARFCRDHAIGEEVEYDLNLALEELFVNSVNHGGCGGVQDAVQIRLQLLDGSVQVEYSDRGNPFNPLDAPEPNLDGRLEERRVGGLGVHLVRQVMGDLRYRHEDGWNRLTMRRLH